MFLSPRLEMRVSWRVIFWSITSNCVLQQKPPEVVQYRNRAADCLSWLGHTTCLSGFLPLFAEVGRCEKTVVIKWEPFFWGDQFFSANVWVNLEGFPLVHWFLAGVIHIMTHEKPLGFGWQFQTSKLIIMSKSWRNDPCSTINAIGIPPSLTAVVYSHLETSWSSWL